MANKYVRAGAGGTASGDDWTNAYTALPATLTRGNTYYIADGSYTSTYTFDDAVSGTTLITVKKATQADHGTDTGWDVGYGDGVATLGVLAFQTNYIVVDGNTGGGPGSWKTGHGFKVYSNWSGDQNIIDLQGSRSNIAIKRCEIGNASQQAAGYDCAFYSSGGSTDITVQYCWVHNVANEGFVLLNSTNWLLEYCAFDNLDVNSESNHGVGWYLGNTTTNFTLRYCLVEDITDGTGWFGLYGGASGNCNGIYIHGNVFRSTDASTFTWGNGVILSEASYAGPMQNVKIYNNTFYNLSDPSLVYLPNNHASNSGNEFKNNIVYGTNGTPAYTWSSFIKSHNASDAAISGDSNIQTLTTDPVWDAANYDFRLGYNTTAGADLGVDYDEDYLGTARTTWSRGALEYVSPITPPSDLTATASGSSAIALSWTDNASDETGYVVERSLNGTTGWTEIATLAADSESYTDSGLLGSTAYHYRVKAYNAYGSSAYSDVATDTTDAAPVLSAGVSVGAGAMFTTF